jgi:hypothetical protein
VETFLFPFFVYIYNKKVDYASENLDNQCKKFSFFFFFSLYFYSFNSMFIYYLKLLKTHKKHKELHKIVLVKGVKLILYNNAVIEA